MSGFILPTRGDQEPIELFKAKLAKIVRNMGRKTTRALINILNKNEELQVAECSVFAETLENWEAYLIENNNHLGKLELCPVGPNGSEVYHSLGMTLYWEISRMKVLVNRARFPELVKWKLSDHEHLKVGLGKAALVVDDDSVSVMTYTQNEIVSIVYNLVEVIDMIPYTEHLREFIDLIDIKCSTFLCQTMSGTIIDDETFRLCAKVYGGLSTLVDSIEKNRLQLRLPL